METIESKFILFDRNKTLTLLKDAPLSIFPLHQTVFEDATIEFNDNGSITLTGDEWQFGISFHDESPSNFDYEVHPNYITKTSFRKKDVVRSGWHRKLKNERKKLIIGDYIIKD